MPDQDDELTAKELRIEDREEGRSGHQERREFDRSDLTVVYWRHHENYDGQDIKEDMA